MTAPKVKCVVWDLDNTVWDGILLEDREVTVRPEVVDVLHRLDERGVLHSIASRNDAGTALARLRAARIDHLFLVPQIGWSAKSDSVAAVAQALNIGIDTLLFVDDDPFERAEVVARHPSVRSVDAVDAGSLADRPELVPDVLTPEAAGRRRSYQQNHARTVAEESFSGAPEEFLASLDLRLTLRPATDDDLQRAEELTVRTNQLNATGHIYSRAELAAFADSDDHLLLVAGLADRFGDYGTIGVALVHRAPEIWTLKQLLVSCRVMSRGIPNILLRTLADRAVAAGARLRGEFVPTDRNRPMLITYRFAGFETVASEGAQLVLEHPATARVDLPDYLDLVCDL